MGRRPLGKSTRQCQRDIPDFIYILIHTRYGICTIHKCIYIIIYLYIYIYVSSTVYHICIYIYIHIIYGLHHFCCGTTPQKVHPKRWENANAYANAAPDLRLVRQICCGRKDLGPLFFQDIRVRSHPERHCRLKDYNVRGGWVCTSTKI